MNSCTTRWSCGKPLARPYCKLVARFKSAGSFGYLGIVIEVESFLLENRPQIQERDPFFSESAEVEIESNFKVSALIELKGKQLGFGRPWMMVLRNRYVVENKIRSNLLQDLSVQV